MSLAALALGACVSNAGTRLDEADPDGGGKPDSGAISPTELDGSAGHEPLDADLQVDAELHDGGAAPDPTRLPMPANPPAGSGNNAATLQQSCTDDAACDDDRYCNGIEICVQSADVLGTFQCAPGLAPCGVIACDDETDSCDCDFRGGDADGDNHVALECGGRDCDDRNADIFPGAAERCDDVDDDCVPAIFGDLDADSDEAHSSVCRNLDVMSRQWLHGGDREDTNPEISPSALELCDGVDNDCDLQVDETADGQQHGMRWKFFRDGDSDGVGGSDGPKEAFCRTPPPGWVLDGGDCQDQDPLVHPGVKETCNGADDDCDQMVDEPPFDEKPDFTDTEAWCDGKAGWKLRCPQTSGNCDNDSYNGCEAPLDSLCHCRACNARCRFACGDAHCEEISALATGFKFTCAITGAEGGLVSCWGHNGRGQLGDDSINSSPRPRLTTRLKKATKVVAGGEHACAIEGEQRALYCWGDDEHGQLGAAATITYGMIPLAVTGVVSEMMTGVTDVAAGNNHTCAIYGGGKLACWGLGDDGRLADRLIEPHYYERAGDAFRASTADVVTDAERVVLGAAHGCIITRSRQVECWGDNSRGQLGDGTTLGSRAMTAPVPLLSDVDQLAAGLHHTCALTQGLVRCWGDNKFGQLGSAGDGTGTPASVDSLDEIASIAAGADFTCALDRREALRCWGSNYSGQLGDPVMAATLEPNPVPRLLPLSGVTGVFGGMGGHVCATTRSGAVVCWGANTQGELGSGLTAESQPVPAQVLTIDNSKSCAEP